MNTPLAAPPPQRPQRTARRRPHPEPARRAARTRAEATAADPAPGHPDQARRILEAAQTSFFTHGVHTVTMADLARDLGMSKKTLYRYFPDKEALLEAVIERFADSIAALFSQPRSGSPRPVATRIQEIIAGISDRLATLQPAFVVSLKRSAPRQFERLEQLRRRNLENHLRPLLESGQRSGEIRRDLEPAFAIEVLLQTLRGVMEPETLHRLQRTPAQAVSGAVDLVLRGLLHSTSTVHPRP